MSGARLRSALVETLRGGSAHVGIEGAVEGLEPSLRYARPPGLAHSVWELLEHVRIALEDIARYSLDPDWSSPPWPEGYWPERPAASEPDEALEIRWEATLEGVRREMAVLETIAMDGTREPTDEIPHGEGRTWMRQVLLAADHTAYHTGQIVDARRALGAWPPEGGANGGGG